MVSRLNPYLNFDGDARAALEHYRDVFGGDLDVRTYGSFGNDDEAVRDLVMHGQLETPAGFLLMAADVPPGHPFQPGNTTSISVSGDDVADLRRAFHALAEGGTVVTPLQVMVWGDEFGQVTDRFGLPWLFNIAGPDGGGAAGS